MDVRRLVLRVFDPTVLRAVAEGAFRQDLYYRLQVVTLTAPPLREHMGDLPALVEQFLAQACLEHNLPQKTVTDDALDRLAAHDYPGNVRELRNLIERMLILTPAKVIDATAVGRCLPASGRGMGVDAVPTGTLREMMAELERRLVLQSLERHGWKMTATATTLGLERSHLYKKLKALGIERPD